MYTSEIKWKRASEQLPKQSCMVLTISDCGLVQNMPYSDRLKKFNCYDDSCLFPISNVVFWEYRDNVISKEMQSELDNHFERRVIEK